MIAAFGLSGKNHHCVEGCHGWEMVKFLADHIYIARQAVYGSMKTLIAGTMLAETSAVLN